MSNRAVSEALASAASDDAIRRHERRDAILLTTDYRPQMGGIAEYLAGLWREAAGWGDARVLSTVPGGERVDVLAHTLPRPPERNLGARFGDRVPTMRRVNTLAHFASLRRYAHRTLSPLLQRVDEQSRICIGVWSPLAHFWCETLAAAGQPYALFAHGLDVIQPLYSTVTPWREADFRAAARVIANSAATADVVAERLGADRARIRVVNPGIDIAIYAAPTREEVAALRQAIGLTGDRVVLSVGRLVRRKGFDVALRAFAEYRRGQHRGEYVIAGDGPERSALEALATELGVREHVRFVGAVDERTKITLYEMSDVFVMPNSLLNNIDWEGFGIVFLEAARAGKPSLGGANGGVADAIVDGLTGLLVDPGDARSVADALGRLLTDDALRARLGSAARLRAAERFDWPAIGAQFRSVLEESW